MKTLVMLNADARSDALRFELLDSLLAERQGLDLWFYSAEQDLSDWHQPLDSAWSQAQLWIHVSAFDDVAALLSWLQTLHESWLTHTRLFFYSGGGLKDWQPEVLMTWLQAQRICHEIFKPTFPVSRAGTGFTQLSQVLTWLESGLDPRQRAQQAESLIDALMFGAIADQLNEQFRALTQLYPESRRPALETAWQKFLNQGLSLKALKDLLFSSED